MGAKLLPEPEISMLKVGNGSSARDIAVQARKGKNPGVVWLGGYRSDMSGTKAQMLDQWAAKNSISCCRHDYSGHGQSGGEFGDGTISRWLEESLAVFDQFTDGPQIIVGSSMGAWVALRMVQELNKRDKGARCHALLLLAPAPDFTHELMKPEMTPDQHQQMADQGYMELPTQYSDEPNIFTRAMFEDGEKNRVMDGIIDTNCPAHIIHGMDDEDVPFDHALKLLEFLPGENVTMSVIKDGDHRLSRDNDIALMIQSIENLGEPL